MNEHRLNQQIKAEITEYYEMGWSLREIRDEIVHDHGMTARAANDLILDWERDFHANDTGEIV